MKLRRSHAIVAVCYFAVILTTGCGATISKVDRQAPSAGVSQFEAQAKVHRYLGASAGTTTARFVHIPRETNQPDGGHDLTITSAGNLHSVQIAHPSGGTAFFHGNDRIELTWKLDYQRMGSATTSTDVATFTIAAPSISIVMSADEIDGGDAAHGQVRTPSPVVSDVQVDLTVEWQSGASGGFPVAHVTIPTGSMLSDSFTFTSEPFDCPSGTVVVGPGGSYRPGARVSARAVIAEDEVTATSFVDVNCTDEEE